MPATQKDRIQKRGVRTQFRQKAIKSGIKMPRPSLLAPGYWILLKTNNIPGRRKIYFLCDRVFGNKALIWKAKITE